MDLEDQLRNLFPNHKPEPDDTPKPEAPKFWLQDDPLLCKYEKRKGKPITLIEGYNGAASDFKKLTKALQNLLGTGGSHKNETIIIQGDFRDKIMDFLKENGFSVKRVGG